MILAIRSTLFVPRDPAQETKITIFVTHLFITKSNKLLIFSLWVFMRTKRATILNIPYVEEEDYGQGLTRIKVLLSLRPKIQSS